MKLVSGRALAFHVNELAPGRAGIESVRAPPAPRYHDRAVVPGMGNLENDCSKAGSGWPGDEPPAPLSNRIRTGGSFSNAASALSYVGSS